jgi:radical SAM superfamily enzyme YgiQ (UPF0313 family)
MNGSTPTSQPPSDSPSPSSPFEGAFAHRSPSLDRPTRTRHVVLVSLDWIREKDPRTSLGHGSLLATLRRTPGITVSSVRHAVNAASFDANRVLDEVMTALNQGARPLVAIGAYVWNEHHVRRLIRELRAAGYEGEIVIGGPQVSYAGEGAANLYPEADVIIRGYGEEALAALAVAPFGAPIRGAVRKGDVDRCESAQFKFEEAASPILDGTVPLHPFMRWETQRGCPYRCSFCQHRESGARQRKTAFPLDRLLAEIDAMVLGNVTDIAVLDPIFTQNPDATLILGRFRERGFAGRLSLQCRFEELTEEFLQACEGLNVRLEFGLQTTNREESLAVRRPNRLELVETWMAELNRRAIPYEISLIYGLPLQTLSSFRSGVEWCLSRGAPTIRAFPLMLLRGTPLEAERERYGLRESNDPIPVVVETATASVADIKEMARLADALNALPATAPAAAAAGA